MTAAADAGLRYFVVTFPMETEAGQPLGSSSITVPVKASEEAWASGFDFSMPFRVRGRRVTVTFGVDAGMAPGASVTTMCDKPVAVPPDEVEETIEIRRGDAGEIVGITKAKYTPAVRS